MAADCPMVGRTLAHYQIQEKLGQGGMGVVYRALDTHLDRHVAIKVLPPEAMTNPERKRRFVKEAKAASALNHPNIITIYDIDEADGVDFIAMEYVAGVSLDRRIGRRGLPLAETLRSAVQIADALSRAHAAGIIHRDVKPANIMVTGEGSVKVLDFGLVKLTQRDEIDSFATTKDADPHTKDGFIVGTAAYMSPEQAEGRSVDARSDVFAFGSLLYEMVSGRGAFQHDTRMATLAAVLREEPAPLPDDCPRDLQKIVTRCLRKDATRRFQHMGDVKIALEELKEQSESGRLIAAGPVPRPRRRWVWAAAAVTVALLAAILWLPRLRRAPDAPLTATPLTSYPGREASPTFSPEGNQVAFSWDGENGANRDIYVKLIGPGTPLRLTTDLAEDIAPAWSPDGQFIAFLRLQPPDKAAIMLVPALSGPERELAEVLYPVYDLNYHSSPAWSPDSKHLVVTARSIPTGPGALFLVSVETGEKRKLIDPPTSSIADSGPAFSPDGRALVFNRQLSYQQGDLHSVDLPGDLQPAGEPRRLTFDSRPKSSPVWTPDGRDLVYASSQGAAFGLWRLSPSKPGPPERLASIGQDAVQLAISRRPPYRLAYRALRNDRNIWRVVVPDSTAAPFLSSTRIDRSPQYSPDGRKIAFGSQRTGGDEIWTADASGANAVALTALGGPTADFPRWSPDGRHIAFHARPQGEARIFVIGANAGKPRQLTDGPGEDVAPSWSRDGRWIYFGSGRSGRHEIWKVPPEGGSAAQVTWNGGIAAFESHDGKFLYYTRARGNTSLWRMPVAGGPETRLVESLWYVNFIPRPEGLYFLPESGPGAASSIQLLPDAGGAAKIVAKLEPRAPFSGTGLAPRSGLTVSPDGRTFLFAQTDEAGSDLMLVENFR